MKKSLKTQTARRGAARTASLFLISTAALAGALQQSWGQVIYATGFEPPTFVADLPLVGQDGWVAPPPLSPNAAMVTQDHPRIGRQTVHMLGDDLEHQDFIGAVTGGYYDAIGSYRRAVEYDSGGTQVVRVSARVRIDGPKTATGNNFFSASIAAIGVDANGDASGIGELAISSDGHVYGYSSQDLVPTFLTGTRVSLGKWHRLTVELDFAARTYKFLVNGASLGTFAFDPSATSNVLRRGSLIVYAAPDSTTNHKADYAAHFDNFSIKAVSGQDRDCDDED